VQFSVSFLHQDIFISIISGEIHTGYPNYIQNKKIRYE